MFLEFHAWKQALVQSTGSASAPVLRLGDYVLELFWREGCEPTLDGMLEYAQAGLCRSYNIRASGHAHVDDGVTPAGSTEPALPR